MELHLKDKVIVVTGGTSGIGLATVESALAGGAKVAFCARGETRLKDVFNHLKAEYGEANLMAQAFSVLDESAVKKFASSVEVKFGTCHALITNAGSGRVSTFANTSDDDWHEELELKFFSQLYPIRAFQKMLESSNHGAIVAVNSLLAYQPELHMVCTSAARAGVQNLLKSLANEFAPKIRVNSILLGLVDSGQWQKRFDEREDKSQTREQWYEALAAKKQIPLQRLGEAQEAANALLFLASPLASYITGAQIEVSGGVSRHI